MRENFKKLRLEAGMTQKELADKMGISVGAYRSIESGKRITVKIHELKKAAKALDCSIYALLDYNPDE